MLDKIWSYKKSNRLFLGLLLLAVLLLVSQNWQLGLLLFIVVAACIIYAKQNDSKQEKLLMGYLDSLSQGVSAGTVYAVKNLPLGIAMMDNKKKIVWANNVFRTWSKEDSPLGLRFQDLITGQKLSKIWEKTGWFDCYMAGSFYRVFHKFIETGSGKTDTPYMVFYFQDRSDVDAAIKKCKAAMPVFCLVRIDNMVEVTADMTDVEKSSLLSDVNKVILEEFTARKAFIKQYSQSDFVVCLSHEALVDMMEENFEILDKVRAIKTVNRIPVTLSIGVVQTESTFAEGFEQAQVSLDLALGRGGDQAIVRTGNDMKAFGGKAPAAVSSTRVRVRVVAQALKEIIESSDMVLVMGHTHEDFDALGSAVGVAHLARASGVETHIVGSPERDTCRKMADAIEKSGVLDGLLIDENQAKSLVTDNTVLVIVDTHIPNMVAAPSLLEKIPRKVVIDHHRRAATIIESPLLTYMEPSASSASELVTELVQYYEGKEDITSIEASCLYAGIVVDTKNFAIQTSVRTFDAASYLQRCGADISLVRDLFRADLKDIRAKAKILSDLDISGDAAFAVTPKDTEDSQIIAGQVADFLITINEIHNSFVFYYTDKGLCISARSDGRINMQVVMEALGGGGHQNVAGAQLGDADMDDAKAVILKELAKQKEEEQK